MTKAYRILISGDGLRLTIPVEVLKDMGVEDANQWAREHVAAWERSGDDLIVRFLKLVLARES